MVMGAVTLGEIGQLPRARKPVQGVNYRALTAQATRLRADLPRAWATIPEPERAKMYGWAFDAVTFRPSRWHLLKALPFVLKTAVRLQNTGQLGDFVDYTRSLSLLWDDILSLSENDLKTYQRDVATAVQEALNVEPVAPLRTRADIDDWLRTLV
jgi:hypothetical protein